MKKYIKITLKMLFFTIFLFLFFHLGAFVYAKISPKVDIKNVNNISLYDKDARVFFQGVGHNEWIPLNKMSSHIINATISIEDKHFYSHIGFDYFRIVKSFYENLKAGSIVQGASTITQQYARNLYLGFDKDWSRKIEEAWLAFEIEVHYTKDEILEGYLNTINYGNGVLGIENAAKFYFDKSASYLSLAEASMLVGIPRSPTNNSPLGDEYEAKKRQYQVLTSMVKNQYITEKEKEKAFNNHLIYHGKKERLNLATLMYYQNAVMKELNTIDSIPNSLLKTGGLKIFTNLDVEAQHILEESVSDNLKNNLDIQVAAVVVEPTSGSIIALTGGRDYLKSQFNRATDSKRQVGSTMKPFLYYAALEHGFTSSTTFLSEPTTFTFSDNKTYSPKNYANLYPGKPITMAAALAYSDNIYAIKTHLFLGEETLVDIVERVGIKEKIKPYPSLPLGTEEINIIDFLTGYNTLANEGDKLKLHLINRIEDTKGNILYEYKPQKINVLNKNITYVLNELLSGCYDYNMIDYAYPTGMSISPKITKKYALKTGSTDYDTWSIGFNKDVLVGVWNGYDVGQKLGSTDKILSRKIWVSIVEKYLKESDDNWYKMPNNVVGMMMDPITGEVANENTKKRKILYYVKGTEPLVIN